MKTISWHILNGIVAIAQRCDSAFSVSHNLPLAQLKLYSLKSYSSEPETNHVFNCWFSPVM